MTVTIGSGSTRRQRHESASGRVSAVAAVLQAFDAHVAGLPPESAEQAAAPALRRIVRALLPLAWDDPAFDVTSTLGDGGVGVRVHRDADGRLRAQAVAAPPVPEPPVAGPAGAQVVGELADLLRRRRGQPR